MRNSSTHVNPMQTAKRMNRISEEDDEYDGIPRRSKILPPSATSQERRSPLTTNKRVSFSAPKTSVNFAPFLVPYGFDNAEDSELHKENVQAMPVDRIERHLEPDELTLDNHEPKQTNGRPIISRSSGGLELGTLDMKYQGPTPLHQLCYDAKSFDDFLVSYAFIPGDACITDDEGKLPLHIMGENRLLAMSERGKYDPTVIQSMNCIGSPNNQGLRGNQGESIASIQSFVFQMLHANSLAIITPDFHEHFPFESTLQKWILQAYNHTQASVLSNSSRSVFTRTWMNTSMSVSNAFVHVGKSFPWNGQDDSSSINLPVVDTESMLCTPSAKEEFPKNVRATAESMFAIQILSHVVEYLQDDKLAPSNRDTLLQEMINRFAAIPDLIKTILLVESDDDRKAMLSSAFIQQVVLHESTVGSWLTSMLTADRSISRIGVQYLAFISELSLSEEFYESMSNLEGFIPSLLGMDELSIEQAATTTVVKHVMDRAISRPFCVGVVFTDGLFLTILIVGFRAAVNTMLTGGPPSVVLQWVYVANTAIFYFLIRELGKAITILERTKQATIYLWSFWNVTDISSTVLALVSVIVIRVKNAQGFALSDIDPVRTLLAITTGLLWLRMLSLLKTLNIQLATFVLAIVQITKDILWFCVILAVVVASFSQMFYTLLLPASCAVTIDNTTELCSQKDYYLRTFTVLLGDQSYFARSSFTTTFSVFLIVFFSFMVVIVLLNVLIAIVSDSYEKCLVRSHYLFGRARVMLIAELVSFQNLLRTEKDGHTLYGQWWSGEVWNRWSRGSVCFFLSSTTVVVIWVVGETAGYFSGEQNANYVFSLLSVFVIIALYVGIIVSLSNAGDERNSTSWHKKCFEKAMLRLLGSSRESLPPPHSGEGRDEWRGRIDFLSREMLRISTESNLAMRHQVDTLELRLATSSIELRREISNMESKISGFKEEILMELRKGRM